MTLLRRRRLARLLARAHGARSNVRREWRWAARDLRDLRRELRAYRERLGASLPAPTSGEAPRRPERPLG